VAIPDPAPTMPYDASDRAMLRTAIAEARDIVYLAMRAVRGLPLNLPATRGVHDPTGGEKLHKAK
jgi:1,6-anhydro-N-acetylmuramate kinase